MGTVSQIKKSRTAAAAAPPPAPKEPKGTRSSSTTPVTKSRAGLEIYGLLLTAFAILVLLSLVSFDPRDIALDQRLRTGHGQNLIGPVGAHIADLLLRVLGLNAVFLCSTFFYFGGLLLAGRRPSVGGGGLTAYLLVLSCGSLLAHVLMSAYRPFGHMPGGVVGAWSGEISRTLFATTGTILISVGILAASILRLTGLTARELAALPGKAWRGCQRFVENQLAERRARALERQNGREHNTGGVPLIAHTPAPNPRDSLSRVSETAPPDVDGIQIPPRRGKAEDRPEVAVPRIVVPGPEIVPPVAPMPVARPTEIPRAMPVLPPRPVVPARLPAPPIAQPRPQPPSLGAEDEDDEEEALGPNAAGARPTVSDMPRPSWGLDGPPIIEDMAPVLPPSLIAAQDELPLGGPALPFEFPSLTMLDYEPPRRASVDKEALNEAATTLEAKLLDFGVKGKVVKIQPGPVVTMFEFLPAPGIKISKISSLVDDLTMALHAQRVRIVAPIPGKGVVGIEVPSAVRETVYLKEILASKDFQESRGRLPICLGKDLVGMPVVTDLAKAPHMLVAGATGSGKSVAINAFILSLVYKSKPSELRLILVDPKILELSIYDDIPHLLLPVVTEPKKAALALKWAVAEMDRRYLLMSQCGVRNIAGFNAKIEKLEMGIHEIPDTVPADELVHLPYIVIILDELADLMMVAGKEVEQLIARLAQKARASGIHLVLATQRPSVDVITGLIKANFPTRLSFMVSQSVDSRTILDRKGAESLLGQGDMLFLPPGTSLLQRIQGCFVSDEEVERVTTHLKKFGPPEYDMNILEDDDEDGNKDLSKEDYDSLYDDAVMIVCESNNPSISYLQRRLKIGYNRSARIIERMEFDGVISKPDHRGVRKVMVQSTPED